MYCIDDPDREDRARALLYELPFISNSFYIELFLDLSYSKAVLDMETARDNFEKRQQALAAYPNSYWCLYDVRKFHLLNHDDPEVTTKPGDIDVLIGKLEQTTISGQLQWLPSTDFIIGIEVKAAYLSRKKQLKSTDSSRKAIYKIRSKIKGMFEMGLDRVVLLDVIFNPPMSSEKDGQAWLQAGAVSGYSTNKMKPILKDRLPSDSLAGHWVWSKGSIAGCEENEAGSGAPEMLQIAQRNMRLQDEVVAKRRETLQNKLKNIFNKFSNDFRSPFTLLDCKKKCNAIHLPPFCE